MIKFHCPKCQQKIGVPDSQSGKRIKCPGCSQALAVPALEQGDAVTGELRLDTLGDERLSDDAIAALLQEGMPARMPQPRRGTTDTR
jgi:hypothetical protein